MLRLNRPVDTLDPTDDLGQLRDDTRFVHQRCELAIVGPPDRRQNRPDE